MKIAIAGNPNCGKTVFFNAATGGRQKVANYPGVTVERVYGDVHLQGETHQLIDLPGTYSLDARTMDESVTRDVLLGKVAGETRPDAVIAVVSANHLEQNLAFVLELRELGLPLVVAVNMADIAISRGREVDLKELSKGLQCPVLFTTAISGLGVKEVLEAVVEEATAFKTKDRSPSSLNSDDKKNPSLDAAARFALLENILSRALVNSGVGDRWTTKIDRIVLHPVWGFAVLGLLLALIFQAIFSWATWPADFIEGAIAWVGQRLGEQLPDGPVRGLIQDGVIAGVGSVLVFLPQILILFGFLLLLEDSGYMARAAFIMDRAMSRVGLHGRAFIPMLSSFACAIPGIMATRTIENRRDRLTTILVAPLATCSARLPVYALLIGAFIPAKKVFGFLGLQGLVLFILYVSGILLALGVAALLKRTLLRDPTPPLLLELPEYRWPSLKNVFWGMRDRGLVFIKRAGTVILSVSVVLWYVSTYPAAPEGATEPAIFYSYAGTIGRWLEPLVAPIGFDWKIAIALIPGFAAREVMVGALATVYAVDAAGAGGDAEHTIHLLSSVLREQWSLPTALSLLAWYVVALQCLSTIAVTRRETNSWKWPLVMLTYLTALAYLCSWVTFHVATWWLAVG